MSWAVRSAQYVTPSAAANGATIKLQPSRPANSIEGRENEAT